MKKFILLITSVYISIMSATSAIEAMIASGVASGLMPLLKPIAEKTLLASIDHAKKIITGATCPVTCRGPTGVPCKIKEWRSTCKQRCQKIILLEGYRIKVRFGENGKWDLVKCVEQGIKRKQTTARGKGKVDEIAVYNQRALDGLLTLLAYREAAGLVKNVKGYMIEDVKGASSTESSAIAGMDLETIRQRDETLTAARARAAQEATKLIQDIDEEIAENLDANKYGYQ